MFFAQYAAEFSLGQTRFFSDLPERIPYKNALFTVYGFFHAPILGALLIAPNFGAC